MATRNARTAHAEEQVLPPSPHPIPPGFVAISDDTLGWRPATLGERLVGRFGGFGEMTGRDGVFPVVRVRDDVGTVWAVSGRWIMSLCERGGVRVGDDVVVEFAGYAEGREGPYRRFRLYVRPKAPCG